MMERLRTRLEGLVLIRPTIHRDERGFFHETWRRSAAEELGLPEFVQDNHSRSSQGIVRGMHYQPGMGKLVRCVRGAILDVAVDVRRGSPTFGEWEGVELNDESLLQFYSPPGFAHGFAALSAEADVVYRCTAYHDPSTEGGVHYADPDVGIEWPEGLKLRPSERDANNPPLREIADALPFEYEAP